MHYAVGYRNNIDRRSTRVALQVVFFCFHFLQFSYCWAWDDWTGSASAMLVVSIPLFSPWYSHCMYLLGLN